MSIYYPTDKNGNEIPFRTPAEYIYDDDFVTLATKLSTYDNRIDGKETEIGGAIPTSIVFSNNSLSMKNSSNTVINQIKLPSKSTYPPVNVTDVSINKRGNMLLMHWVDPDNSYADVAEEVPIAVWQGTRVVIKKNSAPVHPNDGERIIDSTTKNQYTSTNPLIVSGLTLGTTYYIRFFPYGIDDTYNASSSMIYSQTLSENTNYGFHIDYTDSNPSTAITYLEDAVGKTPVHMDFTNGTFDWGDWYPDEFMMPRPCLLNYDGTVEYYLDINDYTKKEDGTASKVADSTVEGNFMMEWGRGGRKIWYKVVPDSDPRGATVYIANYQVDSGFHCWNFYDASNTVRDHFYTPIYSGSYIDECTRSLSGQTMGASATVYDEIDYACANNTAGELSNNRWYTETFGDRTLINYLLVLLGKSLDTQTVYGWGNSYGVSTINTGTMNDKGLFWGENTGSYGVKVFGMENWWGNVYRRIAGWITNSSYQYVKLTPNTADGSSGTSYGTTTSGMISSGVSSSNSNTYTKWYKYNSLGYGVIYQNGENASTSTYYCDYGKTGASDYYACVGGNYLYAMDNGAFASSLLNFPEATASLINSSISYR